MKNLGGVKPGVGLSFSFFIIRGAAGQKGKHHSFPLRCAIYCDNEILMHLILEGGKHVYAIIITLAHRLAPHKMRGFIKYISHIFLKFQCYIRIYSLFWLIIIIYCTNPLIPERSCTRTPINMSGSLI